MNPNQFLLWMKGFRDSMGDTLPTETQWAKFNEVLDDALANEVRGKLLGRPGKVSISDLMWDKSFGLSGLQAHSTLLDPADSVCKIDTTL